MSTLLTQSTVLLLSTHPTYTRLVALSGTRSGRLTGRSLIPREEPLFFCGYRVLDLDTKKVVKLRDVIFGDDLFPYSHEITKKTPLPAKIEIDWPLSPPPTPLSPPPLRITVFRSNRRLQASIHNPENISSSTPLLSHPPSPLPSPPLSHLLPPPVHLSPPSSSTPLPAPRRSSRVKKVPVRYGTSASAAVDRSGPAIDVPKTWNQVLRSPNKDKWVKAADAEFATLLGMKAWKLVPRPAKRKIIKSKWIFKPKLRLDGSILKLKARLVAMG